MRCVVDGCNPVFSLISLSETDSSREASTSISANMRSMTWMVGVAAWPLAGFLMGSGAVPRFYLVKRSARLRPVAAGPGAVHQHLVRLEPRLVVHLGTLRDPVPQVDVRQLQLARLVDLPQHAVR